jgi:uncharacterized membrane protein
MGGHVLTPHVSYTRKLKYAAWTALVLWMMLTGSYPGISIIAFYCLMAYALYFFIQHKLYSNKKDFLSWLKVGVVMSVLTLLLTAPHLLSIYEYLPEVTRTEGLSKERLLENPFPPKAWVSMLIPYAVGTTNYIDSNTNTLTNFAWESDFSMLNGYMGLLVIFGLLFWIISPSKSRREIFLFFGFVLLMALASGELFPLRWWSRLLPGLDLFRHPSIFRFMALFAAIVLGALSLNRFSKVEINTSNKKFYLVLGTLATGLIALVLLNLPSSLSATMTGFYKEIFSFPEHGPLSVSQRIFVHGTIQLLILGCVVYLWTKKKWNYIPVVVFLDLFIAVQLNIHATVVYPIHISQAQKELKKTEANRKEYSGDNVLLHESTKCGLNIPGLVCNHNIFLHQPAWDGYNSYILDGYRDLEHSGTYPGCFNHPLIYSEDSTVQVSDIRILPNEIRATTSGGPVILQQNYHSNWRCEQNGEMLPINRINETMMKVEVAAGPFSFIYSSRIGLFGLWSSLIGFLLVVAILFFRP